VVTPEVVDSALLRWIPAAPLAAALAIGLGLSLVRRRLPVRLVAGVSCLASFAALALSAVAFAGLVFRPDGDSAPLVLADTLYTWVGAGVGPAAFSADFAFRFDALTAVMCFVVGGTGLLVNVYAIGYVARDAREDAGAPRYFCYLALLLAAMFALVLADNLLLLFLGWQGVGVAAWLLTGFWYADAGNAEASARVFVAHRVGDAGFVVGTLLLFWSLSEAGVPAVSLRGIEAGWSTLAQQTVPLPVWLGAGVVGLPTLIGLSFLVAVAGKSAQLPLYLWPTAAAAGPAPGQALLDGATQMAAGVYLVSRLGFVFDASPVAAATLAWCGGLTAVLAAVLACVERDLRRLPAWAAISQAGLMFVAAGAGAFGLALFHLTTMAVVTALLVLGAATVVVALDGESDLQKMGGLRARLEPCWWVLAIGALTLSGVPPLSVFFSAGRIHEAILVAERVPANVALYSVLLVTTALTAFYATRMVIRIFHGEPRVRRRRAEIRPPGSLMMWPLYVLAGFAVLAGVLGVPQLFGDLMDIQDSDSLGNFLAPALPHAPARAAEGSVVWTLLCAALAAALIGFGGAYSVYLVRPKLEERLAGSAAHTFVARGFFVPEVQEFVLVRGLAWVSQRVLDQGLEQGVLERGFLAGSAAGLSGIASRGLRFVQSGLVQVQLLVAVAGAALCLLYLVGWL